MKKNTNIKSIMTKIKTTNFFIACKESRIENNTSFYGCFYLGPFDDSLSQTLANDLRRTLLSELTGLSITSVEILGVLHKFSTLPGMKETVLDLICNLQNIVLKKSRDNSKTKKTYIGYLNVNGPRVIKAIDLKLPAGLKCVDPNQYILTLAEDGFLNMKLYINEGKNFIKQKPYNLDVNNLKKRNILLQNLNTQRASGLAPALGPNASKALRNKNLVSDSSHSFILSVGADKGLAISTPPLLDNKRSTPLSKTDLVGINHATAQKTEGTLPLVSNQIPLDAVFMPVTKINCIIEESYIYSAFSTDLEQNKINIKKRQNFYIGKSNLGISTTQPPSFWPTLGSHRVVRGFTPIPNLKLKSALVGGQQDQPGGNGVLSKKTGELRANQKQKTFTLSKEGNLYRLPTPLAKQSLGRKNQISPLAGLGLEYSKTLKLKPLRKKSQLIIEIWTNGSIHPRQALYQSFSFLSNIFLKLQTTKMLGLNNLAYVKTKQTKPGAVNQTTKTPYTNFNKASGMSGATVGAQKSAYSRFSLLNTPISLLPISLRSYTALRKKGIFTLNDLSMVAANPLNLPRP